MGGFEKHGEYGQKYDCQQCKLNGHYTQRNCPKYFPKELKERPFDRWMAMYRTSKGTSYDIEDTQIDDCPVSYITPHSLELIQIANRTDLAKEKTGAAAYGPDLSKYPSRMVDVFTILEREGRKVDQARTEAEEFERE